MMVDMTHTEPQLPLANPEDWTDTAGAACLLGRSRPTVYDMVDRGLLTRHKIGTLSLFWVPEVVEISKALARLARQTAARRG
jgi:hypothetical protein